MVLAMLIELLITKKEKEKKEKENGYSETNMHRSF